jgi:hypothetical protein
MCLSGFLRLISKKRSQDVETNREVNVCGWNDVQFFQYPLVKALLRLKLTMSTISLGGSQPLSILSEDKGNENNCNRNHIHSLMGRSAIWEEIRCQW